MNLKNNHRQSNASMMTSPVNMPMWIGEIQGPTIDEEL